MFIKTADNEYINLSACVSKVTIIPKTETIPGDQYRTEQKVVKQDVQLTLYNNTTVMLTGDRATTFLNNFHKITV